MLYSSPTLMTEPSQTQYPSIRNPLLRGTGWILRKKASPFQSLASARARQTAASVRTVQRKALNRVLTVLLVRPGNRFGRRRAGRSVVRRLVRLGAKIPDIVGRGLNADGR